VPDDARCSIRRENPNPIAPMTDLHSSPLGHATTYADAYDPALLFPVERGPQRAELGLVGALPFRGRDIWTAYELSWLDPSAKPQVAVATFTVPADSPASVESKSVKLYLTAFNQTRFSGPAAVASAIRADLSAATGAPVDVALTLPAEFATLGHAELAGESIDGEPFAGADAVPLPGVLGADGPVIAETLTTRLFRSVCPVTGQPDFASVQIGYRGPRIDRAGLLRYLVSFRRHSGFHEHCVERIFVDLLRQCRPGYLTVLARFTRRGGVDINPWRTTGGDEMPGNLRTARQ
jgi:7-cyano-7-deazaguanine reductase